MQSYFFSPFVSRLSLVSPHITWFTRLGALVHENAPPSTLLRIASLLLYPKLPSALKRFVSHSHLRQDTVYSVIQRNLFSRYSFVPSLARPKTSANVITELGSERHLMYSGMGRRPGAGVRRPSPLRCRMARGKILRLRAYFPSDGRLPRRPPAGK